MVLEREVLPYLQWLLYGGGSDALGPLPRFLLVFVGVLLVALVIGFGVAAGRHGFLRGGDVTYHTVAGGLRELWDTSLRRVWALAKLAIKESLRRRVVVAIVLYFVILLLGNWFLHTGHKQPARLYLGFVLGWTTFLVLSVALLLSSFSLPGDFKSRTIYTVVTKPVRASEIILGRILGFTIIATVLLAIMGLMSYVFVVRSLDHTHRLSAAGLERHEDAAGNVVQDGQTSTDAGHVHDVVIDVAELEERGEVETALANGHTHTIERDGDGYRLSGPNGYIRARVPQYGKLRFIDRSGAQKDSGISVGSEWTYRSFIDGNTPATAIWTFSGVDESIDAGDDGDEEKALRLALIVRVFRTHKGTEGPQGALPLQGTLQLQNPVTKVTSAPINFDALDAQVDEFDIARKQRSTTDQEIDVFDDLVSEKGQIEVLVKCLDRGQYFGFAQADCYLRLPDGSPVVSLAKVFASIWVQAVIVIAVGVTISTLVSGPVAMLFTSAFIILGFYRESFLEIAYNKNYGGGPAESVIRIANQSNVMVALDEGLRTTLVTGFDRFVARPLMWGVGQCLPDFKALSTVKYAAEGYNVPWDRVFQDATTCLAYVASLSILGFFLLRTREGSAMNPNSSMFRKAMYLAGLAVLALPLAWLGMPSARDESGGRLAQLRSKHKLGQADLGAIDPASEAMRLITLGARGFVVTMMWNNANHFKKTEDWTSFQSTLEQLARLQPYFVKVWQYQAWNLSYNVSVEVDNVRDRFFYVKQGIKYLKDGIQYLRDNPTLLDDLGWFCGNKVGRADEHKTYRRLFKLDDELTGDVPPEQRDSWLVSKEWYELAVASIDEKGQSLGQKNPTTFYDSPARSQISYAEAIEEEGVFRGRARQAWEEGGRLWREYGMREMPGGDDLLIRLEDQERWQDAAKDLRDKLDKLSPGLEGRMKDEASKSLTPVQRQAIESTAEQLSAEQSKLRQEATDAITITVDEVAGRIGKDHPDKAAAAVSLVDEIKRAERRASLIEINREVANYEYWRIRCDLEQTPEALEARELAHAAKRVFLEKGSPSQAKELYEQSFDAWAKALAKFPELPADSSSGSDLLDLVKDYAKVLRQLELSMSDEEVADRFPLWHIVEANDQQREFFEATEARKNRGGGIQTGGEGKSLINPADALSDEL